eukprot:7391915-Prymnesium_polylepis.1
MDVFCVCVLLSQLYWTAVDTNGNADPASQQARDETEQRINELVYGSVRRRLNTGSSAALATVLYGYGAFSQFTRPGSCLE